MTTCYDMAYGVGDTAFVRLGASAWAPAAPSRAGACWSSRRPRPSSSGVASVRKRAPVLQALRARAARAAGSPSSALTYTRAMIGMRAISAGVSSRARRAGIAHVKPAGLESLAGRHDGAGADDHVVLDHHAVEHDRADADQHAVADRAAVRRPPCGAITTSSPRMSGQPVSLPGYGRETCSTLPSCTLLRAPMRMWLTSPRTTAMRPDRHVVAELDVADHERRRVDVDARAELRMDAPVRAGRASGSCSRRIRTRSLDAWGLGPGNLAARRRACRPGARNDDRRRCCCSSPSSSSQPSTSCASSTGSSRCARTCARPGRTSTCCSRSGTTSCRSSSRPASATWPTSARRSSG